MRENVVDFVVIGAGIAGVSIAAHLAETHRVLVLEAEDQPAYHSTGRSAALFSETYGPKTVRALSSASKEFYGAPPAGFAAVPLVTPRGSMIVARPENMDELARFGAMPDVARLSRSLTLAETIDICPILRPELFGGAVYEPGAMDIDVHGLHQGYLRLLRARGGTTALARRVEALDRGAGQWKVHCGAETYSGRIIINAAGAWADQIGAMAGARPIGLQPKRRTALLIDAPAGVVIKDWPLVLDLEERFYFKPDAGNLLISPSDATPNEPTDVQPDEMDIAIAIDRFESVTTAQVWRVKSRWAGLRSFVSDGSPVAGFDDETEGFFWLAGQGGYGIQTAPALSRAAAALACAQELPEDIREHGIVPAVLCPARVRSLEHGTVRDPEVSSS